MPIDPTPSPQPEARQSGGEELPDNARLELGEFDLLPATERRARLAAQWRDGRPAPDRVIALWRTVADDALSMSTGELLLVLGDAAVPSPRSMFRAWDRAQVAIDVAVDSARQGEG